MTKKPLSKTSVQRATFFILAVLGFSFWFFLGVPFASHRETYSWLVGAQTQSLAEQFSFGLSSTYRPLSQVATWVGFLILNPHVFPTNALRQGLLQGFIYGMFILAWWLIYSAAPHRRLFALVAFVGGGVFFSGYVHLFHIYGMFYVPTILTLAALLYLHASHTFEERELWFAAVATVLALWHPFATALFLAFYFGFCVETFQQRSRAQRVQAAIILLVGLMVIVALVGFFPRAQMPPASRLLGFLVSYQTNEVNRVASFVAFLLSQMVVLSMLRSRRVKFAAFLLVTGVSAIFFYQSVPLMLIWFGVALIKLFRLGCWSIFFLMLSATLLPFGGGIGAPSYGLFAIIVAIHVTSLEWPRAERALSFFAPRYAMGITAVSALILLMVRAGIEVPIATKVAMPLLTERERTYQLESALAWLHKSDYCGYNITFTENAGSPIDSVDNVITRRNRPPAALEDVRLFWNDILRCAEGMHLGDKAATAVLTFGASALFDARAVFVVKGKYAGDTTIWIPETQQQ